MVDLIPIGTINRSSTENNPNKVSDAVEQTNPIKPASDEGHAPRVERRKMSNRRRGTGDRRLLKKSARKNKIGDRRQTPDRRMGRRKNLSRSHTAIQRGRVGSIIDETV